jgi:hypothetical protein
MMMMTWSDDYEPEAGHSSAIQIVRSMTTS